jgi:hypothetical protein
MVNFSLDMRDVRIISKEGHRVSQETLIWRMEE